MLKRPRLFLSDRFHLQCDTAARRNMQEALTWLEQDPSAVSRTEP